MLGRNFSIHICHSILPESFEETSWDSDCRWSQKNHTSLHSTAGHRVLIHSPSFLWLYLGSSSSLLSPVSTFIIRVFTGSWVNLTPRIWKWGSRAQLPTSLKALCFLQSRYAHLTHAEGGLGGACDRLEGKGTFTGPVCLHGQFCLIVGGALKKPGREVGLIFFPLFHFALLYTFLNSKNPKDINITLNLVSQI